METSGSVIKTFTANILWSVILVFLLITIESFLQFSGFTAGKNPLEEMLTRTEARIRETSDNVEKIKKRKDELDLEIEKCEERLKGWVKENEKHSIRKIGLKKPILEYRYIKIPKLEIKRLKIMANLNLQEKTAAELQQEKRAAMHPAYKDYWMQNFREHALRYFYITAFFILFSPLLWCLFMYYGIAGLIEKVAPVFPKTASAASPVKLLESNSQIRQTLRDGETIYLRGGWCKDRRGVKSRTKILWRWQYPLVSWAADLCELVAFSAQGGKDGVISITAPYEDLFIGKIDLNGGEIVIRPRYLIGVSDTVQIKTKWNFSLHNILSGRIRQIILHGNGFVFIAGSWGVEQRSVDAEEDHRIEFEMLLGYDYSSRYSLCRTETFWHYFRQKASLFDVRIQKGTFLTQNNAWSLLRPAKSTLERVLNVFLNGIGGLLGF